MISQPEPTGPVVAGKKKQQDKKEKKKTKEEQPPNPIVSLRNVLLSMFPAASAENKQQFDPHLSVGQFDQLKVSIFILFCMILFDILFYFILFY